MNQSIHQSINAIAHIHLVVGLRSTLDNNTYSIVGKNSRLLRASRCNAYVRVCVRARRQLQYQSPETSQSAMESWQLGYYLTI